jgi:hypothetical protein
MAFCSQRCWLGGLNNCGGDGTEDEEGNRGLCRFPEDEEGLIGDVGFCAQVCDCDDDCAHPDAVCAAFDDAAIEALAGGSGVCLSSQGEDSTAREGLECD